MAKETIKKRGKNKTPAILSTTRNEEKSITEPSQLSASLILQIKPSITKNILTKDSDESVDLMQYTPVIDTPKAYDENEDTFYALENKTNEESSKLHTADSIWCWWCCHPFQTKSLKCPVHYRGNNFECVGNFCSPECTAAFILESGEKYGDKYEEMELLHSMLKSTERIKPAPSRESLNVFGGDLSIEEFRKSQNKCVVIYPPMVSLKLHMDEVPNNEKEPNEFLNINSLVIDPNVQDTKKKKTRKTTKKMNTLDKYVDLGN